MFFCLTYEIEEGIGLAKYPACVGVCVWSEKSEQCRSILHKKERDWVSEIKKDLIQVGQSKSERESSNLTTF